MPLQVGNFVTRSNVPKGLAKIVAIDGDLAQIEWFVSIPRHCDSPLVQTVSLDALCEAIPSPQTRCYVSAPNGNWQVGRILSGQFEELFGVRTMRVKIGGEPEQSVQEKDVWVRCLLASGSPLETLASGVQDTPYFHPHRHAFLRAYGAQRSAARGLTGLLSARIKLFKHQVQVVRRVLEDPICRYLLADEVGLGKTIEAGIIARQLRLDQPKARILVVVPSALKKQWQAELEDKFLLSVDSEQLVLLSTQEIIESPSSLGTFELVIFDEAHHIGAAHRDPERAALWAIGRELAHTTPRLLLLSATPALGNEADFAAMLHLLEPQTYNLDDLDSFRRRVNDRQEVGQFLNSFNPPLLRVSARRALPRLRALFSDDAAIMQATNQLEALVLASAQPDVTQPHTLWQQEDADRLARLLRLNICESYRLHRRIVRTSRRTLDREGVLAQLETGERLGATPEWDFDPRLEAIHDNLESWREAARWHISLLSETEATTQTSILADIYAVLWTCAATWHHLLRLAIECRLGNEDDYSDALGIIDEKILRTPLFEGEETALAALLEALSALPTRTTGEPGDALEVALSMVAQQWKANQKAKVVVFTSSHLAAQTLSRRLRALDLMKSGVWTHLESEAELKRSANLNAFEHHDGPGVLLCDRSGEEGLNLQFASAVVLFDVPPDPNRLEQRLGRLDRIGHAHDLRPRLFAGWSGQREFGDPSVSIHEAWFAVLNDGFRLFKASVADLGFVIDAMLPRLKRIAFELGPQGLLDEIPALKAEVEQERVKIREQSELDETEAFERDDDSFFESLELQDREGKELSEGVHRWMSSAWQFGYDGRLNYPLVRFVANDRTLVPRDWSDRLLQAQDAVPVTWPQPLGGCYSRELACSLPATQLLRPGSGLLDELHQLSLWDDRGQAFAMWRATPLWEDEEPGIFFRFDFLIEADSKPVKDVLKTLDGRGWDESSLRAMMRQAESWLPPIWKSYVFDLQGRYVSDPKIIDLISPEYKLFRDSRDYNLDAERLWAFDQLIPPDKWKKLCPRIGNHVVNEVRKIPRFKLIWSQNAEKARQDGERRLELARRGMLRGAGYSAGKTTIEQIAEQLAQEKVLNEALCAGIAKPNVRMDAVGVYVLSRHNPFIDGHKNSAVKEAYVPVVASSEVFPLSAESLQVPNSTTATPTAAENGTETEVAVTTEAPVTEVPATEAVQKSDFEMMALQLLTEAVEAGVISEKKRDSLLSYYKAVEGGEIKHRLNGDTPAVLNMLCRSLRAKGLT